MEPFFGEYTSKYPRNLRMWNASKTIEIETTRDSVLFMTKVHGHIEDYEFSTKITDELMMDSPGNALADAIITCVGQALKSKMISDETAKKVRVIAVQLRLMSANHRAKPIEKTAQDPNSVFAWQ